MKAAGSKIRCTERLHLLGEMVNAMKDTIRITKSMDKANSFGPMERCMMDNGKMENNTEMEIFEKKVVLPFAKESGRTEKEQCG